MLGVVALLIVPSAEAAEKPVKRRAEIVCFKKAGKKVCRPRRATAKKVAARPRVPLPVAELAPPPDLPTAGGPAPSPAAPATPPGSATRPSSPTAPQPDCGTSPWVGLTAEDVDGVFRLTGRRTCVPGPSVAFQLRNTDAQAHNLYAEGVSPVAARRAVVASAEPDQTVETTTTLTAGEWRLFCDIEGHETMSRTLTVTG